MISEVRRADLIDQLAEVALDAAPMLDDASWLDQLTDLCTAARLAFGAVAVSVAHADDDHLRYVAGRHVRQLGPGDSFGEIALLRDVPRTATVCAADDTELVLQGLERDDFLPAVTGQGDAAEVADAVVERWLSLG